MSARKSPARRLAPDEREQQIVTFAVGFFAEYGFEGQTRELARRMGITQPLLYRYFPSKEALIERVYAEVFSNRWQPLWERGMGDPATPAAERLTLFYQDYARAVLSYEWVRLLMFGGLKGSELTTRYARLVFERVFPLVIEQVRLVHGKPPLDEAPMTEGESERLWTLHASIAYVGIRRWIYGLPVPADQDSAVADLVATFLLGGRPW